MKCAEPAAKKSCSAVRGLTDRSKPLGNLGNLGAVSRYLYSFGSTTLDWSQDVVLCTSLMVEIPQLGPEHLFFLLIFCHVNDIQRNG